MHALKILSSNLVHTFAKEDGFRCNMSKVVRATPPSLHESFLLMDEDTLHNIASYSNLADRSHNFFTPRKAGTALWYKILGVRTTVHRQLEQPSIYWAAYVVPLGQLRHPMEYYNVDDFTLI